ncbi:MAG: hypothetical protein ACREMP_10290 [Candidatus Tyrphobacter sp.]
MAAIAVIVLVGPSGGVASAGELSPQNMAGSWQCTSNDGNAPGLAVFSARPNVIDFTVDLGVVSGVRSELRGEFDYDSGVRRWTLHERQLPDLAQFIGYAGSWTSQTWTFAGAIYPPDPGDSMFDSLEPARISLIAFGNDAFEMIRTQETGGQWVSHDPWTADVLDESCSRLPPAPGKDGDTRSAGN